MVYIMNVFKFRNISGRRRNTRYILKPLDRDFGDSNMALQSTEHKMKLTPDRMAAGTYVPFSKSDIVDYILFRLISAQEP